MFYILQLALGIALAAWFFDRDSLRRRAQDRLAALSKQVDAAADAQYLAERDRVVAEQRAEKLADDLYWSRLTVVLQAVDKHGDSDMRAEVLGSNVVALRGAR